MWYLALIAVIANFVACGGGGGSSEPGFTVSTNELTVGVTTNSGQGADQTISGTVTNYSGTLYIIIAHTNNGISTIYQPIITGDTGTSTIVMQYKTQGVYFDTITVYACSDANCNNQLPGSPQIINVTYTVGISVDPPVLSFSAPAGVAPAAQTVTVYYDNNSLSGNSWASSYLYLDGSGWMSYNPPSGQAPTEVTVSINPLPEGTPAGIYNAEIRFGANAGKTLFTLPVAYTVE